VPSVRPRPVSFPVSLNADALSRMPVVQDEDGIEEDIGRLRTATSSTSTRFACQEQF